MARVANLIVVSIIVVTDRALAQIGVGVGFTMFGGVAGITSI